MDRVRSAVNTLNDARFPDRVRRIAGLLAVAIGALDAWFFRDWNLNPDGVSYFDLAQAFAHRGVPALINGYWSPLYPATIGLGLRVFAPGPALMYPMVRAINLVIFIGATLAFDRLLRTVLRYHVGCAVAPVWARVLAVIVAYELYLLLALKAIGLHLVTPDMGVALVVFWACAELVALAAIPATPLRWARLGAVLAVGYWWKAILFPVSGVILLVAYGIAWRRRDGWRGPLIAGAAFSLLALVLIIPVSRLVGRPTFGETGRLNQLWFVNEAPHLTTLCVGPGMQIPVEPVRTVRTDSVVLAHPLTCALPDRWPEATLPLWYDASYWYRDTHAYLSAAQTWDAVRRDVVYVRDALAESAPWLISALGLVALLALLLRAPLGVAWPLVVLAVVPPALYLLVYVELRHIVPFLIVGAIAVVIAVAGVRARWRLWALGTLAAIGVVDVSQHVSEQTLITFSILRHEIRRDPLPEQLSTRVAHALAEHGVTAGDRVATLNALWNVEWAQRAGIVVRAYTPEFTVSIVHTLAALRDPCVRARYAAALARTHIRAAVLNAPIGFSVPDGFIPLDNTGYYLMPAEPMPSHLSCPG